MPAYDLSPATLARVAGQNVDVLRIADTTVWTPAPPAIVDTLFDGGPVPGLNTYSDAPANSWEAVQLARYPGPTVGITAIGIYVPPGSGLISRSGFVGLQFSADPFSSVTTYTNTMPAGQVATGPLVAGWNWIPYVAPWPASTPNILVGYALGAWYLYSTTVPAAATDSTHGLFKVTAQAAPDTAERSWWDNGATPPLEFVWTNSRSYGLDLRVSP